MGELEKTSGEEGKRCVSNGLRFLELLFGEHSAASVVKQVVLSVFQLSRNALLSMFGYGTCSAPETGLGKCIT